MKTFKKSEIMLRSVYSGKFRSSIYDKHYDYSYFALYLLTFCAEMPLSLSCGFIVCCRI